MQVEEGLVPPDNPDAIASGGSPLKEEESTNISLGFTTNPFEDLNITVDYYHISVDDRIYRTGDITAPSGSTISFYTNALDVEHQGLDIVASSSADWSEGVSSRFTLAYNYGEIDVVGQRSINGITPVSDSTVEDIENNYPDTRWVFTAVTDFNGEWELMVRANYYGEHYDERGTIGADVDPTAEVDAIIYVDMELTYHLSENLDLTLGASNVFDDYINEIGEGNANRLSVGLPYPRRTPANYEGGSWYLRANYQF